MQRFIMPKTKAGTGLQPGSQSFFLLQQVKWHGNALEENTFVPGKQIPPGILTGFDQDLYCFYGREIPAMIRKKAGRKQ